MENPKNQTLADHIEALRATVLRCVAAVALAFPIGLLAAWPGIRWLADWVCPPEFRTLYAFQMMDPFLLQMKFALLAAVVLAFPWCVREVWNFAAPGLRENERRAVKWWAGGAAALFALGVAMGAGFVMPLVVKFFLGFQSGSLTMFPSLRDVMEKTLQVSLAFGVAFQFPLLLLMLARFGVVRAAAMARGRPYIIVGILIAATLLTPPDVISQIALAIPLWILFEATLLVAGRFERHEKPAAENDDEGLAMYEREMEGPTNGAD